MKPAECLHADDLYSHRGCCEFHRGPAHRWMGVTLRAEYNATPSGFRPCSARLSLGIQSNEETRQTGKGRNSKLRKQAGAWARKEDVIATGVRPK